MSDLAFGECEGMCGGMVDRVGWDRYCSRCLAEMDEELNDRWEAMDDEDDFLYGGTEPRNSGANLTTGERRSE